MILSKKQLLRSYISFAMPNLNMFARYPRKYAGGTEKHLILYFVFAAEDNIILLLPLKRSAPNSYFVRDGTGAKPFLQSADVWRGVVRAPSAENNSF